MIYLACPYSHKDPAVREARFEAANEAAGLIMSTGIHVFSPISHCHPIAQKAKLPTDWEYWSAYDQKMIMMSDTFCVLRIDGWKESTGVAAETKIARELKKPCQYTVPATIERWSF